MKRLDNLHIQVPEDLEGIEIGREVKGTSLAGTGTSFLLSRS